MTTRGLMPKELNGAELVERRLYYFAYSGNQTRRPIPSCRHGGGRNIISSLEDGPEVVATLDACAICGRVLRPHRVFKDGSKDVVPLGAQKAAFNRLTSFILRF